MTKSKGLRSSRISRDVKWIELAQNGLQWHNFPFINCSVTVSCSRRTLYHGVSEL